MIQAHMNRLFILFRVIVNWSHLNCRRSIHKNCYSSPIHENESLFLEYSVSKPDSRSGNIEQLACSHTIIGLEVFLYDVIYSVWESYIHD